MTAAVAVMAVAAVAAADYKTIVYRPFYRGGFLYAENHAIVAWFSNSLSNVRTE